MNLLLLTNLFRIVIFALVIMVLVYLCGLIHVHSKRYLLVLKSIYIITTTTDLVQAEKTFVYTEILTRMVSQLNYGEKKDKMLRVMTSCSPPKPDLIQSASATKWQKPN